LIESGDHLCAKKRSEPRKKGGAEHVLIVDDSASQRRILSLFLVRWGFRVSEADSGSAALKILEEDPIDVVISDWMMPEMTGLELCRSVRQRPNQPYVYFILLTSKSEKLEIAKGLDMGADDFVSKPVSSDELLARIRAGERILKMERELRAKNLLVSKTLEQITTLYEAVENDLSEARKLQQSLVRESTREFGASCVSLLLRSSGHVGGDLVGFVPISDTRVGLFSLDVSGHGVASAMLTARLAGLLKSPDPAQNIALERGPDGRVNMINPAVAARKLNDYYMTEIEADQYFTMVLADVDLETRRVCYVQCGHPNPAIQHPNGEIEFIGKSGFPIGLFEGLEWEDAVVVLPKGARLLLVSDGMTECESKSGEMLDEPGLAALLDRNISAKGTGLLDALVAGLAEFSGTAEFADDVSGVLLETECMDRLSVPGQ